MPQARNCSHRLPIVAYGSSAIPETLAGAGVCLASKEPTLVAAAVHRVLEDEGLQGALARAGEARLRDFDLEDGKRRLAEVVGAALS